MGKDYEIKSNWYALFIAIVKYKEAAEALRDMGIARD